MEKEIWLAGGCFWGVEAYFQMLKGVISTSVGYAQGNGIKPTYEEVCTGKTGYAETVKIIYNDNEIKLNALLSHMFRFINPTSLNKQGADEGTQYRTGVYYSDKDDRACILAFINQQKEYYELPLVVEVEAIKNFFEAEDYHQDYLLKNPKGYCHVNLNLIKSSEKK